MGYSQGYKADSLAKIGIRISMGCIIWDNLVCISNIHQTYATWVCLNIEIDTCRKCIT